MPYGYNRKPQKNPVLVTKNRKCHIRKKWVKNPIAIIRFDRDNITQTQYTINFPEKAELKVVDIPKEKNPDLKSFWWLKYRFTWRTDLNKGAIYDYNGIFCGTIEKEDYNSLFIKIGRLLKEIK